MARKLATYNVRTRRSEIRQGGISNEVWNQPQLKNYINGGNVFGYVGHEYRTIRSDKMMMQELKHVRPDVVAEWMTSGDGRHMADGFYRGIPDSEMRKRIHEYTKNIIEDVAIWRHPEFEGTLGSRMRIKEKYFK